MNEINDTQAGPISLLEESCRRNGECPNRVRREIEARRRVDRMRVALHMGEVYRQSPPRRSFARSEAASATGERLIAVVQQMPADRLMVLRRLLLGLPTAATEVGSWRPQP